MVKPAKIALMGGMGYPLTETQWGMPTLKRRLEAIGCTVLLVSWDARQQVYDFLHGFAGAVMLSGDSLGAGSAGQYAGDLKRPVDFAGGFQPSRWDARTKFDDDGDPIQTIAGNIRRAHCIYDPWFIDTGGLGQAHYVVTPGSETKLTTIQHRGMHPDDWGYSQDVMFGIIHGLLTGGNP